MELSERAAWWHRSVMTHNAPHTSFFFSVCPALLCSEATDAGLCLFPCYQALYHWYNTDWPLCWKTSIEDAVNYVNNAQTHTQRLIACFSVYVHVWKKRRQRPQTLTEYFGTDFEVSNRDNCYTRCFISQHKEKKKIDSNLTAPLREWHCLRVLSNRAHFSLTQKQDLCK